MDDLLLTTCCALDARTGAARCPVFARTDLAADFDRAGSFGQFFQLLLIDLKDGRDIRQCFRRCLLI